MHLIYCTLKQNQWLVKQLRNCSFISSQNQLVQHGKGVGIAQLDEHQDSESITGFSHVLTLIVNDIVHKGTRNYVVDKGLDNKEGRGDINTY